MRSEAACYAEGMGIRASVIDGRLVVDQATDLPNGTVLDLVIEDEGDDLDAAEIARIQDALESSHAQAVSGRVREASGILRELQARR